MYAIMYSYCLMGLFYCFFSVVFIGLTCVFQDSEGATSATDGAAAAAPAVTSEGGDATTTAAVSGETSPATGGAWGGKATFANVSDYLICGVLLLSADDDISIRNYY